MLGALDTDTDADVGAGVDTEADAAAANDDDPGPAWARRKSQLTLCLTQLPQAGLCSSHLEITSVGKKSTRLGKRNRECGFGLYPRAYMTYLHLASLACAAALFGFVVGAPWHALTCSISGRHDLPAMVARFGMRPKCVCDS